MATRRDLVQCVIEGIEEGQANYENISGGYWAWEGAEYWLTVHVALSLWKLIGDGQVTVETRGKDGMETAGRSRGPRRRIVDNGMRFDILLWHKNEAARAPIEIKSQQTDKSLIIKDVKRVIAALMGSGMKFGIVGYYFSRTSKTEHAIESVESYVVDLQDRCKNIRDVKNKRIRILPRCSKMHGDKEDAWIAGSLLIVKMKKLGPRRSLVPHPLAVAPHSQPSKLKRSFAKSYFYRIVDIVQSPPQLH